MFKKFKRFFSLIVIVYYPFSYGFTEAISFETTPEIPLNSEIQWSICEKTSQDFLKKMTESFEKKAEQKISYFETPELYYLSHGVIFRVIKKKDKIKSTLKVAINYPDKVDWEWLQQQEHKCEYNVYQNSQQLSCSIDYETDADSKHLFNNKQHEMVEKVAGLRFNDQDKEQLKLKGPLVLNKWKSKSSELTFETVDIPSENPIMELSIRVENQDKDKVQRQMTDVLISAKVQLCPRQGSRTEVLLGYLK
jgi:hypothetical protein